MECIFCKIGQKLISSYIVAETDNFLAFLDINPLTPGHTIVIPKAHLEKFVDLDEGLAEEFLRIIHQSQKRISLGLGVEDFTLGVNDGYLSGRTIPHLHFHIVPRYPNDNGGSIHSLVHYRTGESLESIYKKLKNATES